MRKIVSALLVAAVCCGVISCNEKPRSYRFIKVTTDGKEEVENIEAGDDTAALKLYIDRMEKIIVANIGNQAEPYRAMYIVSPDGDTLNTDNELLEAVAQSLPSMAAPATAPAAAPAAPAVRLEKIPESVK